MKKIFVVIMCLFYIVSVSYAESNNSLVTYDLEHFSISVYSNWKHEKINDTTHLLYSGKKNEPNYWQMSVRFVPFDMELSTEKEIKDLYATMLLSENHQQIYDYKYLVIDNKPCMVFRTLNEGKEFKYVYGLYAYHNKTAIYIDGGCFMIADMSSASYLDFFTGLYKQIRFQSIKDDKGNTENVTIDLESLSFEELVALKDKINLLIFSSKEWQEVIVPQGVWKVGEDIPAGTWTVKCHPNDYCTSVDWGDTLGANGQSIDYWLSKRSDYKGIYNSSSNPGELHEYTFTVKEGDYIIIDIGRAIFMPYHGKPSLGFK